MTRVRRTALALAAALAWPAAAHASLPQQLGSVGFDASVNRLVFGPVDEGFEIGVPQYIGDINGDGIGDFAIGAPDATDPDGHFTGAVYVVLGQPGLDFSAVTGVNGFVIYGAAGGDQFGSSLSPAGDINGDGKADLIVGAPGAGSGAGAAYVIYGRSSSASLNAGSLGSQGYTISGAGAGAHVGKSVSGLAPGTSGAPQGVLVGAPGDAVNGAGSGAVFVIPGRSTPTNVDLGAIAAIEPGGAYERAVSAAGGWIGYYGGAGQQFGRAVAGIGDFNGGGQADIAFSGYAAGLPTVFVAYGEGNTSATTLAPPAGGDDLGASLAAAGDINGDGLADVVIGDSTAAAGGTERGAAYVLFGSRTAAGRLTSELPATGAGFAIDGSANFEELGTAVSGAGDVNGDGIADVIVGGDGAASGGSDRGEALVVYGSTQRDPATHPTTAGVTITSAQVIGGGGFGFAVLGTHNGDAAGSAVGGGGDVTGDRRSDVLVAAHSYDALDGAVAVVRGFGTPAFSYAAINGQVGTALSAPAVVTARTGTPAFSASGSLPPGLSLDPVTGTVSGTPTSSGSTTVLITMTDDASETVATASFDIQPAASQTCPQGQVGTPPDCYARPPESQCVVPRLHGRTPGAAKTALHAAGCGVGAIRKPRHKPKRRRGFRPVKVVTAQSPTPGAHEPAGTKVKLTLGYKRVRIRRRH